MVLQNLTRRRLRSFFAVLGVAIGIAAVVALVSLARGVRDEVDDVMMRLRGDIIVKQRDTPIPESSRVDESVVAALREVEGVAQVSGYTVQLYVFGGVRVPIYGFAPQEPISARLPLAAGRRIEPDGLREVMLGVEAARNLQLDVGQKVLVPPSDPSGIELEVVGVFDSGSRYQDIGCLLHLRTAQALARSPGQVMMCAVDVVDGADETEVVARLQERFPALQIVLARDFITDFDDYRLLRQFAWAVSALAAVIGAIGVLNTMLMSVAERTREIGMLLALGWSRARVLRMIMAEGLIVSVVGGLAGIGLGVLLVQLVARWLEELPIVGGHDLLLFGQALTLSIGLGLLGSLLPAIKASRLSPVEALRYE
ncbi:MAG: ABC transporter permease [Planctomycetota bacterium]